MPHKDRAQHLDYLRRWKLTKRPAPTPSPQDNRALPPKGAVVFSADGTQVQCHACGRWFGNLNNHFRVHGLDAESYKAAHDIARTASLWPPALQAKQRDAAFARGLGDIGREQIRVIGPGARPRGLTNRLSVRVDASTQRRGIYTRGGSKAPRKTDE